MSGLVVALVGTDHHPFDRLVGWMDAFARQHAAAGTRVVVQHGHSAAPSVAEGRAFLGHDELVELVGAAGVVVCHGGPGTIMDARRVGHVPVCVPRDPERGEHVDGHQLRFAEVAEGAGMVQLATSRDDALARVEQSLEASAQLVASDASAHAAAARFAHHVDPVVGRRVRRIRSVRRALLSRVSR
ncbi:glycosyltransferase [Nocardioides zeae]|uniref:Glycosyltransferase n=1 Tax=Nocardioides imazamoxiresistens TaxID=3231893 RepID=A0ABU3Q024_9ACTN|nr:glycosyltransferase [Nocardioides zeae]MDT9594387.1 glycosyltransferase [Nocardioides zeae]